jgi:hypothetical protein
VAAALLTRKVPKILQAFRLIPEAPQSGLKPVALRSAVKIDPIKDDFFKMVVEARARAKDDFDLLEEERKALRDALKLIANAGFLRGRHRPFAQKFISGDCNNAVTRRSKICLGCSILLSEAGSGTKGGIIARRSIRRCANWIAT